MAYYRLRNNTSGEIIDIPVGSYVCNSKAYTRTNIRFDDKGNAQWNRNYFQTNNSPVVFLNVTESIFSVKPYEYWLNNTFTFVNYPEYTLQNRELEQLIPGLPTWSIKVLDIRIFYNNKFCGRLCAGAVPVSHTLYTVNGNPTPTTMGEWGSGTTYFVEPFFMLDKENEVILTCQAFNSKLIGFKNPNVASINDLRDAYQELSFPYQGDHSFVMDYVVGSRAGAANPIWLNLPIPKANVGTVYTNNIASSCWFNDQAQGTQMSGQKLLYYLLFDNTADNSNPYQDPDNPNGGTGGGGITTGGGGTWDKTSDNIPLPNGGSILANTDLFSLYSVSASTLKSFASFIWSDKFFNAITKLFSDPMEAVISLRGYNFQPSSVTASTIKMGNVDTGVNASNITNATQVLNFGSLSVGEYFGDAMDYNPYTQIDIYLPFIGVRKLDTDEIMGGSITLQYNVDLITGACSANLAVNTSRNGTSLNSVLYTYNGVCGYDIPLSSTNMTGIVNGLIGMLNSQNVAQLAYSSIEYFKTSTEKTGNISANVGALSVLTPYLIITRPIEDVPSNFAHLHGLPYYKTMQLGFPGFTKCQDVFINNVIGTPEETEEIKALLKSGVIF